ncbi:unannotated protein [freshwater metagenome]|uniref:Unannotated protein n=1 Tax=freshwater metagenome TaxID=449393 RepID=A0A6J6U5A4_9ZZZZ|nr:hypothetical protein [Actinomycetota bacterium]
MRKVKSSANLYLAIIIAAITILAIVLATQSRNTVNSFEQGSPQQVIQSYLQSINDGRNDLAAKYFSKSSKCTVEDIDRAYVDKNIEVSLVKTEITQDIAVVHISIQRGSSIFNDSMNNEEQTLRLNRENGLWRLAGIPWPLYNCGEYPK